MKISEPTPQITLAASAFAALGSEQRLAIVKRLVKAGPSGLAMADLGDAVGPGWKCLALGAPGLLERGQSRRRVERA